MNTLPWLPLNDRKAKHRRANRSSRGRGPAEGRAAGHRDGHHETAGDGGLGINDQVRVRRKDDSLTNPPHRIREEGALHR